MNYPYKAKIKPDCKFSVYYRGKLMSPGSVIEICGPSDEEALKGKLEKYHVETEEEKEAAMAKPFVPSFAHNSHPKPPGIDSLSDELKGKTPDTPPASANDSNDTKEEGSKSDEGTPDSNEKPATPPDDSKIPPGTDKPKGKGK